MLLKWLVFVPGFLLLSVFASAETQKGQFEMTGPDHSFFTKLNGLKGSVGSGKESMSVIGGFMKGGKTIFTSDHPLFPVNSQFAVQTIVFTEKVGSDVAVKARIRFVDADNDQFHAIVRRNKGTIKDSGSGGSGVHVVTGGTGKYAGIRGKCPYTIVYKPSDISFTSVKCTWFKR